MGRMWRNKVVAGVAAFGVVVAGCASMPEPTPTPTQSVTVPAPLPPNTGIDGEGITEGVAPSEVQADGLPIDPEQLPPDVQTVPQVGAPAEVVPQGPGIGGEIFKKSPVWIGSQRLSAGFYYPSGTLHGAWDIGLWTGTKVFAAKDGLIVGANDGVKNHPAGPQYAVSGSPSNWLLLCSTVNGKPAVLYYQHLSPGLQVKRGQQVKKGKYVAQSGNTGNSTGPHLHLSSSYSPWACKNITKARAEFLRYDYLRSPSRRVFAPSIFWATPKPKPVLVRSAVAKACQTNGTAANLRYARKNLRMKTTTTDRCGPSFRKKYKAWQRDLGYRGAAADGIPGCTSLRKLSSRGPAKYTTKC